MPDIEYRYDFRASVPLGICKRNGLGMTSWKLRHGRRKGSVNVSLGMTVSAGFRAVVFTWWLSIPWMETVVFDEPSSPGWFSDVADLCDCCSDCRVPGILQAVSGWLWLLRRWRYCLPVNRRLRDVMKPTGVGIGQIECSQYGKSGEDHQKKSNSHQKK
jgi:hypothetical protein